MARRYCRSAGRFFGFIADKDRNGEQKYPSWRAQQRQPKIGADYAIGTGWTDADEIVPFWPDDKATWLSALSRDLNIPPEQIVAVGDSPGDIPMLKFAGRGYYVGPTMPDLPSHIHHWSDADIAELVEDMIEPAD